MMWLQNKKNSQVELIHLYLYKWSEVNCTELEDAKWGEMCAFVREWVSETEIDRTEVLFTAKTLHWVGQFLMLYIFEQLQAPNT